MWTWLTQTNAGLATRLAIGAAIFTILAAIDIRKNGLGQATRWREYLFLLLCVAVALVYGIVNDLITSSISWEYFYYGKELNKVLGPKMPPDAARLHFEAMIVGMKATWTAGLIIAAALLIANNPRKDRRQLSYRQLCKMLIPLACVAMHAAVILGALGYFGWLNWISPDFDDMFRLKLWRPQLFMCVFGIHLGGYVGGLLGLIYCIATIVSRRKKLIFQNV